MSDFILVDLYSQRNELKTFVAHWRTDEVLSWMSKFGFVKKVIHQYGDNSYYFRSHAGLETAFRFDEDGKIVVFHPW